MSSKNHARLLESSSARERLTAAHDFIRSFPPGTEILVVGASRESVDDFVRSATGETATFGLHRFSFWQLVSTLAAVEVATEGLAPATPLAAQSVCARAAFDAREKDLIPRLAAVSEFPGFSSALTRTLSELRLEGLGSRELRGGGPDFADLAEVSYFKKLDAAEVIGKDRVRIFDPDFGAQEDSLNFESFQIPLYRSPTRGEVEAETIGLTPERRRALLEGSEDDEDSAGPN